MASSADQQGLPVAKLSVLDDFVELIPKIYYGINKVFEDSTRPGFSKKEGIVLWALYNSKQEDVAGPYMTLRELAATFAEWFVVSQDSAASEVSKAKKKLLRKDLVAVRGGGDHLHLNDKGIAAIEEIRQRAKAILGATLKNLSENDREKLLEIADQLLIAQRRPPLQE